MLSREEVVAAYRAVLGRDPEDEEIELGRDENLAELGRALIDSDEFDGVLASRSRRRPDDLDRRVRNLEARLPDVFAGDLEAAVRRAEAAELRCADLAAQLLHQAPPASPALRGASQLGAEALRAELAAMRTSTSWRITAPLRAVVRAVRLVRR
jgi:hypothetical protein